jgi:hypothetical protein
MNTMAKLKNFSKTEKHNRKDLSGTSTLMFNKTDRSFLKIYWRRHKAKTRMLLDKLKYDIEAEDLFDNHRTGRYSANYDSW